MKSPTRLHLLQKGLHPRVLNVLLLHNKALAGCCESHLFPCLTFWARERVHTCSSQPGGNKAWTLGCSPIKVMGTQRFQAAFGGVCCPELVQMLTRSLLCAPGNTEEQLQPRNALRLSGTHPSLDSCRGEIAVQQHQHPPSLLHLLWAKGE